MNDRVETRALKLALGEHAQQDSHVGTEIADRSRARRVRSGQRRGHAGRHGARPDSPTINLEVPDPECDLDYVPDIGRKAQIEHAICNCVGFGSKNSALVLKKTA